jgi:hypothetical protein
MPTVLNDVFTALVAALYVGILVSMIVNIIRRQLGYSRLPKPFPRKEDLVSVGASEQIAALLASGRKIDAIRVYHQEANQQRLYTAKAAIDTFLVHARIRQFIGAGASEKVAGFLAENKRIGAIKAYKEERGASLQEAKLAIDAMLKR